MELSMLSGEVLHSMFAIFVGLSNDNFFLISK